MSINVNLKKSFQINWRYVAILIAMQLLTLWAMSKQYIALALTIYWFGFALLLGVSLWGAYKKKQDAKANEVLQTETWLPPTSRLVDWPVEGEEVLCRWQGVLVPKTFERDGQKWVWFKNTERDRWPASIEVKDEMKWWKGVAIFTLEKRETSNAT
jgi:hypothetical protein